MRCERRRQRRQRRRRMADGQHQQIGLQPTPAVGDNFTMINAQRLLAQMRQPPAAGARLLGETLGDIAAKLTALRIDRAVCQQGMRVIRKGGLAAVPAIERALLFTGKLHPRGRNVNPMARFGRGVGHARAGHLARLQQRDPHANRRQAQEMNRHRRTAKSAADNHHVRFSLHSPPPSQIGVTYAPPQLALTCFTGRLSPPMVSPNGPVLTLRAFG